MNIIEKIKSALDGLIPWFTDVPEFTADNEPEKYAIINIAEKGGNYSESENHTTIFKITGKKYVLRFACLKTKSN